MKLAFYISCVFQKLYFILISAIQEFLKDAQGGQQITGSTAKQKRSWLDWWKEGRGSKLEK